MSKLGLGAGVARRRRRSAWTGRLRRPLLLVAVTLLCGIAYLAGIWSGARGGFTCEVSRPDVIVCGDDRSSPQPVRPAIPSKKTGSA